MRVETYGLREWSDDLREAAEGIDERVKKVTGKTCLEIKKHAQRRVVGIAHAPNLGRSFNYDVTVARDSVIGEVGADILKQTAGGRPGPLDHFIENGGPHNAPIPHWRPAADEQIPLWHRYLDEAAVEVLGDR